MSGQGNGGQVNLSQPYGYGLAPGGYGNGYGGAPQQMYAGGNPYQNYGGMGYGMNYGQPMGNPWWQGQQYAMPNPYSGLLGLFSQLQQQKALPRAEMGGGGNYASLGGQETLVPGAGSGAVQNFASLGGQETLAPIKKVVAPINYEFGGGV